MIENVARAKADAQKVRWDDGIPVRVIWRDGRVIWSKIDDEGRDLTTDNSDGMLHHVRSVFVPHGAINPLAAMTVQAEPVAWLYERDGRRHTSILRVTSPRDAFAGWTETPLYAHPPVPQWQGIETAPRDGTVILYFTPGDDGGSYHMSRADDRWNGAHWLQDAAHWMPLPTPPAAGGSDAE